MAAAEGQTAALHRHDAHLRGAPIRGDVLAPTLGVAHRPGADRPRAGAGRRQADEGTRVLGPGVRETRLLQLLGCPRDAWTPALERHGSFSCWDAIQLLGCHLMVFVVAHGRSGWMG